MMLVALAVAAVVTARRRMPRARGLTTVRTRRHDTGA
jgi:hypothetical protein